MTFENLARSDTAVRADDIDVELFELLNGVANAAAIDGESILAEGHHGDDRESLASRAATQRFLKLRHAAECLEAKAIDSAFEQALHLSLKASRA